MASVRRPVAVAAAGLALMTACSGNGDAVSTSGPASTAATVATTPELTGTPSTDAEPPTSVTAMSTTSTTTEPPPATTDAPPTTQPGEPDWVEVVQGLLTSLHDLREAPDVALIDTVCFPGENSCQSAQGAEIRELAAKGWSVIGAPDPQVISATRIATADGVPVGEALWVQVRVESARVDMSNAAVVDRNGEVVFQLSNSGDSSTVLADLVVGQVPGNEWRVLGITQLDSG